MTVPSEQILVLDPGLGLVPAAANSPLLTGVSSIGTPGVLLSFSNPADVRSTLGYGELAEDIGNMLRYKGGPVLAMFTTGTTVGTVSAVVHATGAGPTVTAAATPAPTGRYSIAARIIKGGVLGAATFQFTLDNHSPTDVAPTWSQERVVPSGGTFLIPNSGVTLTFPAGTYVGTTGTQDTYTLTTEPPKSTPTDLGVAATALLALPTLQFPLWFHCQTNLTAALGVALFSALAGQATSLATQYRFVRAFCDGGSGEAVVATFVTAANAVSDKRTGMNYGYVLLDSTMPFEGFSVRKVDVNSALAPRIAGNLISTDTARTASGNIPGVRKIYYDSFLDPTVDAAQVTTMRTWPNQPGFWPTQGYLKSPPGSDFQKIQYGRVMDAACTAVYNAVFPFILEGFRTQADGTIDPLDAADIETAGNNALTEVLKRPNNARGRPGHVSALSFKVDRTININTTGSLKTRTAMRPLGYPGTLINELGFSLNP
jgi:hypothetical protein